MVFTYKIVEKSLKTENGKIKYIDVKSNINIYISDIPNVLNLTYQKNLKYYSELKTLKSFKINEIKNLKMKLNLKIKSETDFLRVAYNSDEFLNLKHIERVTLKQYETTFKKFGIDIPLFNVLKLETKPNHYKRLLWVYMNYQHKFKHIETLKNDIENLNLSIKEFNQYFFNLDLRLNPEKSESKILNFKDIEKLNKGILTNKAKEVLFFYYTKLKKTKGNQTNLFKKLSAFEYKTGLINDNDLNQIFDLNLNDFAIKENLKHLDLRMLNLKNKVAKWL